MENTHYRGDLATYRNALHLISGNFATDGSGDPNDGTELNGADDVAISRTGTGTYKVSLNSTYKGKLIAGLAIATAGYTGIVTTDDSDAASASPASVVVTIYDAAGSAANVVSGTINLVLIFAQKTLAS